MDFHFKVITIANGGVSLDDCNANSKLILKFQCFLINELFVNVY